MFGDYHGTLILFAAVQITFLRCLRCFEMVGHQKSIRPVNNLIDEVLVWLSVWSEVQIVCMWSS